MIEKIRYEFDLTMERIQESLNELDSVIEECEKNEINSIKDVDNFVYRLKLNNLYTTELEDFINSYLKFHND